jgi:hypothetical protein
MVTYWLLALTPRRHIDGSLQVGVTHSWCWQVHASHCSQHVGFSPRRQPEQITYTPELPRPSYGSNFVYWLVLARNPAEQARAGWFGAAQIFRALKKIMPSDGPNRNRLCRTAWTHLPLISFSCSGAKSGRDSRFPWGAGNISRAVLSKTNGKIYDWLPAALPRVLKTGLGVTYIAIGRSAHQLPNPAPLNRH